jgi:hypothetical protein
VHRKNPRLKKENLLVSTLRKAYVLHGTPLPFVIFPFPIEREREREKERERERERERESLYLITN